MKYLFITIIGGLMATSTPVFADSCSAGKCRSIITTPPKPTPTKDGTRKCSYDLYGNLICR